jgi:hypothetical protein
MSYLDYLINYINEFPVSLEDIHEFYSIPENQFKVLDYNDKNTNMHRLITYFLKKDIDLFFDNEEVDVEDELEKDNQSNEEEDTNASDQEELTEINIADDADIYEYINDMCRLNIKDANMVITVAYKYLIFLKLLIDLGIYEYIETYKTELTYEMNLVNMENKYPPYSLYI